MCRLLSPGSLDDYYTFDSADMPRFAIAVLSFLHLSSQLGKKFKQFFLPPSSTYPMEWLTRFSAPR